MTRSDYLIACLAEECAEVIQRVTKAQRFTLSEIQPGQGKSNSERILEEVVDLLAVIDMLREESVLPPFTEVASDEALDRKKEKVNRFWEYARSIGAGT